MQFSEYLSKCGFTVVSGLARGIDTAAHIGALRGIGKTVAVLPSPITNIYPKENERLAKKIVNDGGAIISSISDDSQTEIMNFPIRNEYICAISKGILVIESTLKSGSTITAHHGLKQKKPVFCIPGRPDDIHCNGTNNLIRNEGAILVTKPQMIIDYFSGELDLMSEEKHEREYIKLNKESDGLLEMISIIPITIDEIARDMKNMSIPEISEKLILLEMNGAIKKITGERYVRVL